MITYKNWVNSNYRSHCQQNILKSTRQRDRPAAAQEQNSDTSTQPWQRTRPATSAAVSTSISAPEKSAIVSHPHCIRIMKTRMMNIKNQVQRP
jgi:hypothetical protein